MGRRQRAAETYAHTRQMKSLATRLCMRVTAAYVTARRGAQRLRKVIPVRSSRGSSYIRYAARVADGTQRLRYGEIDDQLNNQGISLYFKLCQRRNSECTRVVKVPVFAKVMHGFQLSLYVRERLRALMSEDSTVKHAMTELGKEDIRPCRQTL